MVNKNYDCNQKLDKISQMEIETTVFEFVRKIQIKMRKMYLSQCWHTGIYDVPVIRFPCPNYKKILLSLIFIF